MGKLIPNKKTKRFDFVDVKGRVTPSVGNVLRPRDIISFLDSTASTMITFETIENGLKRTFDLNADVLSSQEAFHKVLCNNMYLINYKMINSLREYTFIGMQRLQMANKVRYQHKVMVQKCFCCQKLTRIMGFLYIMIKTLSLLKGLKWIT
jgi:hypothetical protein